MSYTIIITTADGKQETRIVDAVNAMEAHNAVTMVNGATARVYPTLIDDSGINTLGIMRGALLVARRTAVNTVKRGGGNTGIDSGATEKAKEKATAAARRISANVCGGVVDRMFAMLGELNAANARCNGATDAARVDAVMMDYSQDTREFFSVAATALWDGIAAGNDICECYHGAFIALNEYVSKQRAATVRELSTEYIIDGGGDIVAFNSAIAQIIRGGEKWTAASGAGMDGATAARLGNAIATAAATLNPTQIRIVELLGRGYSNRQIAAITGRNESTVNRNIAIIRAAMGDAMRGGEFAPMIDSAKTAAAAASVAQHSKAANAQRTASGAARKAAASSGNNCKRTTSGAARKAASDKATQAARAKAYRERKKAAAAMLASMKSE